MIEDVAVRDAGRKGLGVFALRRFEKGEFIFRRRYGPIVTNARIPARISMKKTIQRNILALRREQRGWPTKA